MKINYNVKGAERKALVTAITAILNVPMSYKGAPTFSYGIGNYSVDKNGILEGEDNKTLVEALAEQGFIPETEEYDREKSMFKTPEVPGNTDGTLTIELKFDNGYTDFTAKKENLRKLIESKATLIKAALGEDGTGQIPIEFTPEGTVKFEWMKLGIDHDVQIAWTEFLCAAVKYAKKAQRVTAKDTELSDNPKFDFRVFLVKIGLNSAEFKGIRKVLLRNLEGSTAFKNAETERKWKEKYLTKEAADNEVSE